MDSTPGCLSSLCTLISLAVMWLAGKIHCTLKVRGRLEPEWQKWNEFYARLELNPLVPSNDLPQRNVSEVVRAGEGLDHSSVLRPTACAQSIGIHEYKIEVISSRCYVTCSLYVMEANKHKHHQMHLCSSFNLSNSHICISLYSYNRNNAPQPNYEPSSESSYHLCQETCNKQHTHWHRLNH